MGVRLFIQALIMSVLLPLAHIAFAENGEDGYRLLELDGYKVKWGERTLGAGASISYAFADQSLRFDGARNCGDLAPMNVLSRPDIPFETLVREAQEAFSVWERAANLSFHLVANIQDADIILGAQGQPRMQAFANVAPGLEDQDGVRSIKQALVCLNPEHNWKVGFNGDNKVNDIRYTLIHEIGHAIGLDHPGPSGQVMGFRYTESFADLQPGDLRGVQLLYGKAPTISTE
jgi:hypothetical protein